MFGLMILITGLLYLFYVVDAIGIPMFLVFLILKLCGVITFGWIFVCLPIIIWAATILLTFLTTAILGWISN